MDFATEQVGEAQRVFGYLENIGLEKSVIRNDSKSVNPCHIRAVTRVSGNKKPQLITVGVSYLVELAGLEPASRKLQPSVLHAYSVFYLTISNSDKQDFS